MGDNAGHNYCLFIIGKARIAPLKAVSIRRLELTAAVLSVRFHLLVTKELDLPNCSCVFWTDSTATLQCTQNNTKRFPVFVANRLAIICEHTSTKLLNDELLTDELLTTLMGEVEGIINSRPLVPVTMNPEFDEPLTPNHLLLLTGNPNLPPGIFDQKESYGTRRWAQSQYLAQQFWSRWIKEILPNLALRQKWFKPQPNMQNNDVVLLVDDT